MKRLNSKELQSFAESLNTISEKTKPEDININMLDMLGPLMKSGLSGGTAGLRDALRKKMIEKGGDPAEVDAYMKKMQQNKTAPEASSDAETKPEDKTKPEPETKPELETKPSSSSSDTVPAGSFNISPKGSDRRNEVEAQIKRDNAARTDDQRVKPKQPVKQEKKYSFTANGKTYNMTKAEINSEYDKLRKNPEQAKAFGVASNNAIFKKPAGNIVKSGSGATLSNAPKNDLAKGSTPIVVNRGTTEKTSYAYDKPVTGSMAQRLQAIRARQGRPQTPPAVQPKVQPDAQTKPVVTPNQQSSIQQKVDNVKKPVQPNAQSSASGLSARGTQAINQVRQNAQAKMSPDMQARIQAMRDRRQKLRNQNQGVSTGNTIKTKVNPDSSIQVTQKRSPEATKKIKKSLDI